jgi:hypothetical protein
METCILDSTYRLMQAFLSSNKVLRNNVLPIHNSFFHGHPCFLSINRSSYRSGSRTLCSACGSRFKNGHTGPPVQDQDGKFICQMCEKRFDSMISLGGHRRFCDGGAWRCAWCKCSNDESGGKSPGPEGEVLQTCVYKYTAFCTAHGYFWFSKISPKRCMPREWWYTNTHTHKRVCVCVCVCVCKYTYIHKYSFMHCTLLMWNTGYSPHVSAKIIDRVCMMMCRSQDTVQRMRK